MELEPFTRPLRLVPDDEAWAMPPWAPSPAVWNRYGEGVDRRGIHRLLHAANLPEAELLHMGATIALLRGYEPGDFMVVHVGVVAPLLGRVVLDARYNKNGDRWRATKANHALARRLGLQVIEEFFS